MKNREILEKIKKLTDKEKRNMKYDELVEIINQMSSDEIVELANIIGYPVFTRLCMGVLNHKFVLLQDGSSAIIVNEKGQILLQERSDNGQWGLPGGCQKLGERLEETCIREVKEETNLDVKEEDLKLIAVVSGMSRKNMYPNGDVVINNSALFLVDKYSGQIKWDSESKSLKFFDLDKVPIANNIDADLVETYIKSIFNGNKRKF